MRVVSNRSDDDAEISPEEPPRRQPPGRLALHVRPRQFPQYAKRLQCGVFFRNGTRNADTPSAEVIRRLRKFSQIFFGVQPSLRESAKSVEKNDLRVIRERLSL